MRKTCSSYEKKIRRRGKSAYPRLLLTLINVRFLGNLQRDAFCAGSTDQRSG